ncbi:PREDICTED: pentatricopeptide repeat-containing protein At2g13600-like [Nicotiana attenuata]|uniref:Pentatricopeptide repeat-containing protein n=1 Tax=Nicotiana attenuata TaxID=49451 RepID=A0A1J6J696_NICAT|nr:PREDICTED: pentatricopeptide repeat-containing protein At2g13600-like [Nicotiana attenuata]OIT06419.1 pentatricopeptide repeat-containing protein [Nicotiana attenuata]
MIISPLFTGPWKHHRWKGSLRFFSNICYYRNNAPPSKSNVVVSTNKAITEQMKEGSIEQARKLFDEMPERTVVSWNTTISGYSEWGKFTEALKLVSLMHGSYMELNESTFSSVLSVCARSQSLSRGKQVHGLVLKSGYQSFRFVGSALLYLYSTCCEIEDARMVFDVLHQENELLWSLMLAGYVQCNLLTDAFEIFRKMPTHDVVAWTTLISGYSKVEGGCHKALELFRSMREDDNVVPNEFTLDSVLRASGRLGSLCEGRALHGLVVKLGFEWDNSVSGALVDFYCNCEVLDDAMLVYSALVNPSLNDSNLLIGGLIKAGRIGVARSLFNGLIKRDPASYSLMIKGYAMSGLVEESKQLFLEMPERTLISLNTMITVYSRNGGIDKAVELFEEAKVKENSVTWNSMISGYTQNDQHESALKLYTTMRRLAISQTRSTFAVLFHACSCLGSLQQGKLIHADLIKTPFGFNNYVGTALVDMYSKCGSLGDAQASFHSIAFPNVAAWTALINGYAHHGLGSEALKCFHQMLDEGIDPNSATFVGVLLACTRVGLVGEGTRLFHVMQEQYGITPTLEHYTCLVDLLGRSGHLHEAEKLVNRMHIEPDSIIFVALLNACWFWMDVEIGERVAEKLFSLDPKSTSGCVIMSNMYAGFGRWLQKMRARKVLRNLQYKKDPGYSWIELNNKVQFFYVDDRTHHFCDIIYSTLENLTANVNSEINFDCTSSRLYWERELLS